MKRNVARFLARFIFDTKRKSDFLKRHLDPIVGECDGDVDDNVICNVPEHFSVSVHGKNNRVIFRTTAHFQGMLALGDEDNPVDDCDVVVEEGASANGVSIFCFEDGCKIRIGKDAMLSSEVMIYASDTHSILSKDGMLLNRGRNVDIGDHVWIGLRAIILKNVKIAAGSIVGAGSVVASNCEEIGVYAGNPARLIKKNVIWSRDRPNAYIRNG